MNHEEIWTVKVFPAYLDRRSGKVRYIKKGPLTGTFVCRKVILYSESRDVARWTTLGVGTREYQFFAK